MRGSGWREPLHDQRRLGPAAEQFVARRVDQAREHQLTRGGTRAAMEKFLAQSHTQPRVKMEMTSNGTIKQAVIVGMGLSFLSLHTLGLKLDNRLLALVDVQGSPVVRAWNVVHTLSKLLSPAAEAFRYFVLEHGEHYLARHLGRRTPLADPDRGVTSKSALVLNGRLGSPFADGSV